MYEFIARIMLYGIVRSIGCYDESDLNNIITSGGKVVSVRRVRT